MSTASAILKVLYTFVILLNTSTTVCSVKLIIDADPGVDDAAAIVLALGGAVEQRVDVEAITIVAGNGNVTQEALNCFRILILMNRTEIPIYLGSNRPIVDRGMAVKDSYYGEDSFGDVPQLTPQLNREAFEQRLTGEHAANAIVRIAKQNSGKGDVILVCLGPLSNLALALSIEPNLGTFLSKVIILGGNIYGRGNISPVAEFNFHHDPEAAQVVLNSGIIPIIVPWETLLAKTVSFDRFDNFMGEHNDVVHFLRTIELKANDGLRQNGGSYLFSDQLAMAIAMQPQLITEMINVSAQVELCGSLTRGQMVVDWRPKYTEFQRKNEPNVQIVTDFNLEALIKLIYDTLKNVI